jgi:hypothetical protein
MKNNYIILQPPDSAVFGANAEQLANLRSSCLEVQEDCQRGEHDSVSCPEYWGADRDQWCDGCKQRAVTVVVILNPLKEMPT